LAIAEAHGGKITAVGERLGMETAVSSKSPYEFPCFFAKRICPSPLSRLFIARKLATYHFER
jgi:hypothetical protein